MNIPAGLIGRDGTRFALKSVHIEGRIEGMVASVTIGQHYRNDTAAALEVVHTFPLAFGATLLGAEVVVRGTLLRAKVVARNQAWDQYEEAVCEGSGPILVERSDSGLYTANLGGIEPGETVTLNIRYAQLLRLERGQIRLGIPCAAAPRDGTGPEDILPPPAGIVSDALAEYPLTVHMKVIGGVAGAIDCPTHSFETMAIEGGVAVTIASALLDRDCVLLLRGMAECSHTLLARDDGAYLALARFCPDVPVRPQPLALKILVDCSGSMAGDGMAQARQALAALHAAFTEDDCVSLARFGDHYVNDTHTMGLWTKSMNKRWFAGAIESVEADMGGTRRAYGLSEAFRKGRREVPGGDPACVLLISDGEIWERQEAVETCQSMGWRVFTLGVGNAPAEHFLRELAEKTGGACELVTPNEDIAAVVVRLLDRMRAEPGRGMGIEWASRPIWQSSLPTTLYAGDTVHAFALLREKPKRVPALYWNNRQEGCSAGNNVLEQEGPSGEALVRLGGARRMSEARTPEQAVRIGLHYHVVGERTALFLVQARSRRDKAPPPRLHQIPQMLIAGRKGFGSVAGARRKFPPDAEEGGCDSRTDPVKAFQASEIEPLLRVLASRYARICTGNRHGLLLMRYLVLSTVNASLTGIFTNISEQEKLPLGLVYALWLHWLQANVASCALRKARNGFCGPWSEPCRSRTAIGSRWCAVGHSLSLHGFRFRPSRKPGQENVD